MSDQLDVWVADISYPEKSERRQAARRSLRSVLADYLGEPASEIEIVEGEHGKPRLADRRLEFNLSHSGEIALIAVSRGGPVGVDVERIVPGRDTLALAERALSGEAVAKVKAASQAERDAVFYDCWVRHEARLKCLGVGLTGTRPEIPVDVRSLDVAPGYAAAVAVAQSVALGFGSMNSNSPTVSTGRKSPKM